MVFAATFPILPGKSDRVRNFEKEVAPHRAEWDRLSHAGTFRFYNVYLSSLPIGDFAIYVFDVQDPSKAGRPFTDSPHDTWWTGFFKDVHGADLRELRPEQMAPPPLCFGWKA